MIQFTLYSMSLMTAILFMQMNHPLAMGLTLLVQTILACLISGSMTQTFWFSYILFLIFLGGMLVLFIYVASLASNEMFGLSMKFITGLMMMFMVTLFMMFMTKQLIYPYIQNNEMTMTNLINLMNPEDSLSLMKLYNYPTNMITLLLIVYLVITLIAAVKITNMHQGPLRHHK